MRHTFLLLMSLHDDDAQTSRETYFLIMNHFVSLTDLIDLPKEDSQKQLVQTLCDPYLKFSLTGYWDTEFIVKLEAAVEARPPKALGKLKRKILTLAFCLWMVLPFLADALFKFNFSLICETAVCLAWIIAGMVLFLDISNHDIRAFLIEIIERWHSKK